MGLTVRSFERPALCDAFHPLYIEMVRLEGRISRKNATAAERSHEPRKVAALHPSSSKYLSRGRWRLTRKMAVEVFVRAHPNPKPLVSMPKSDRANVSRDSNRPGTRIEAQTLKPQTGMGGVLAE